MSFLTHAMVVKPNQKKIAVFGGFFVLFFLQVGFSIHALQSLHVSHHVLDEEWTEYKRVQRLEDLLDEQGSLLLPAASGEAVKTAPGSAAVLAGIGAIDAELVREYQAHQKIRRSEHEKAEDVYLLDVTGPLQKFLREYGAATGSGRLPAAVAGQYARELVQLRRQILPLRQSDAALAQQALDQAKLVRRETLRDSVVISVVLFIALILWAAYFLASLNRQARLESFQHKMMTAGLLAQSLAHEVRNPLGVIKSAADLLARRQGHAGC